MESEEDVWDTEESGEGSGEEGSLVGSPEKSDDEELRTLEHWRWEVSRIDEFARNLNLDIDFRNLAIVLSIALPVQRWPIEAVLRKLGDYLGFEVYAIDPRDKELYFFERNRLDHVFEFLEEFFTRARLELS